MTPLTPRPAATVMLVADTDTDTDTDLTVFLLRRHAAMEFAAGVMVFPGGGVDDRDWGSTGPGPAQRFGIEPELAGALVCAAARETFEESGVLFAGPAEDPDDTLTTVEDATVYHQQRVALANRTLSFADFLRRENLVLRADLLRPWARWVTPETELTRRYDTYFFAAALPPGQRADGNNTEADHAAWVTPRAALDDFAAGRSFLLPPTWAQLDALAGRSVAEVLAVERRIVAVQPRLAGNGDPPELEFCDSDRYHQARKLGWPGGRTP